MQGPDPTRLYTSSHHEARQGASVLELAAAFLFIAALLLPLSCGENQPTYNPQATATFICRNHSGVAGIAYNLQTSQHEVVCKDGHFEVIER